MKAPRCFTLTDALIVQFDGLLQTLGSTQHFLPSKPAPGRSLAETVDHDERQAVADLLRVDHIDQVMSVALFRGRALSAQSDAEREQLFGLAAQGFDRIVWIRARLSELQGSASHLAPLAYVTALASGAAVERMGQGNGRRVSAAHCGASEKRLRQQLTALPTTDERSRALLKALADQQAQGAYVAADDTGWRQWSLRAGARLASTATAYLARRF